MEKLVASRARRDPWLFDAVTLRYALRRSHDKLVGRLADGPARPRDESDAWKGRDPWGKESAALSLRAEKLAAQVRALDAQVHAHLDRLGIGTAAAA